MKPQHLNTKTLSIILFICTNALVSAQNKYLKITKADTTSISYPPNSKFQLTDADNTIIISNQDDFKRFTINQSYTLTVYPTYKETADTYKLSAGKLELIDNSAYFKALAKHNVKNKEERKEKKENDYGANTYSKNHFSEGLTMKKTLTPSAINEKQYNGVFEFNNGVTAKFLEGTMTATQNGNTLKIEGRYLIYTETGLIKLSFYPRNGETWWVFEPKK